MEMKKYHFDVEMIIDHEIAVIGKSTVPIATHRMFRNLELKEMINLIKNEQVPEEQNVKITFNIRGVNY